MAICEATVYRTARKGADIRADVIKNPAATTAIGAIDRRIACPGVALGPSLNMWRMVNSAPTSRNAHAN